MKIALLGYGKMGSTIERLAVEKGHTIVFKKSSTSTEGDLTAADVAIDFSTPEVAFDNIEQALLANIPVVSGTTGWLDRYETIKKLCQDRNGSFIYASNFSVGVQVFFHLNSYMAKLMDSYPEYDPAIHEIHHTQKVDAPSGTAITLAEQVLEYSSKTKWSMEDTDPSTLSISAERIGDVHGTHHVRYRSTIDTLQITHEAHSREGFAKGAILAAEWLHDKTGIFSMQDVLGLTK